jgi:hypothetical protein
MECLTCKGPLPAKRLPNQELCNRCSWALGVIPMPEPRRPPAPCMRCNGTVFIRVMPREFSAEGRDRVLSHSTDVVPLAAPMGLTYDVDKKVETPQLHQQRGIVETYVCKKCGFMEWYCQDPEDMPIGPEYMTDVVDVAGKTAYR